MGTVTLSDSDLSRLRDAIRTLVSPLEHPDVDAWRRAVNRELKALLDADKATFQFPDQGTAELISDELSSEDLRAHLPLVRRFQRRIWGDERWIFKRIVALGVCDRWTLYGRHLDRYFTSAYYNEYIRAIRAHDPLMTAVPLPGGRLPVQLYFHHDRPRGGTFEPRAHALLRLLHPALEAGVRAQAAFGAHRARLEAALDAVPDGALLLDLGGRVLHRNPAASSVLESDPQGERVAASAADLARALGSLEFGRPPAGNGSIGEEPPSRTVRTVLGAYRLRASVLNGAAGWSPPLVVVTVSHRAEVAPRSRTLPPPRALRKRFDLTDRQAEVALLLARRLSNREIADALSISPHTARHHTEMVFRKLGISSRRKVRRRILETPQSPPAPTER